MFALAGVIIDRFELVACLPKPFVPSVTSWYTEVLQSVVSETEQREREQGSSRLSCERRCVVLLARR